LDYSDLVQSRRTGRGRAITLLLVLALIAAASLMTMPIESGQPEGPLLSGAQIEPGILAILQRSCQDCHSEATRYPWYSYVAPVSWLIASDVSRGRRHLNLSRWREYPLLRRLRCLSEIANQVKDREMPLGQYTLLHPAARLSEAEVRAIFQWTQTERARLISGNEQGR
jgi:hypothetical protein